ncbi:MAG: DNA-directed RNA polymerase subunit alpha C-terminal domain-containing protein [Thermoguttaceae bacterium]|jgi:DNA-directed RNA polymerase subunit alpha
MATRIPLNPEDVRRRDMHEKLSMSLAEIGLSVRTTNCLDEQGIATVADLIKRSRQSLLDIPNFGEKTLEEVFRALEKLGFVRAELRNSKSGYAPDEAAELVKARAEGKI